MEARRTRLTILTLITVLAGCSVGEYGPEQQATPDAAMQSSNPANESSFNTNVKPLLATCTGCHTTAQPPNLTSYTALQDKYKMKPGSTNILVTKGPHQNIQYFSATDKTTVQNWIDGLQ